MRNHEAKFARYECGEGNASNEAGLWGMVGQNDEKLRN